MKANELPIINFLQAPNVQFVIPVYQRNYDWTNNECKELLNDIIAVETADRGTHFIGSIVFEKVLDDDLPKSYDRKDFSNVCNKVFDHVFVQASKGNGWVAA